jgi:hypothetical protein
MLTSAPASTKAKPSKVTIKSSLTSIHGEASVVVAVRITEPFVISFAPGI